MLSSGLRNFGWYLFVTIYLSCIFFPRTFYNFNLDFGISDIFFISVNSTHIFPPFWYICSPMWEYLSSIFQLINSLYSIFYCNYCLLTEFFYFCSIFILKNSRNMFSYNMQYSFKSNYIIIHTCLLINSFLGGGALFFVIAWLLCYWLS